MRQILPYTLCLISMLLIGGCKKEKNRICDLYKLDVGYSIGTIDAVKGSVGKAKYEFSFSVDGSSYSGEEKAYGIGQNDPSLISKRYVVVYSEINPDNNDLNFDFPIESNLEFTQFQSDYSNGAPPPDFPNKCK